INEDIEDAVERMYCRDEQIDEATRNNHNIFIKQLIKYYPDIFSRHMRIFSDRFSEVLIDNIRRGREQGVFRTDFDETLYPKLFFEMMLSYDSSITLDTEKISREYFKDTTMDFYMNAITTEKGKEAIKKYKNNQVNEKNSI
ncbi:MAG: TetR/AcrR family transcriptional regulator, partial [Bergeyella zoohelcum]|nr:TetR/AcrR family transcriptional regulator [Bergeyella zoohelcum]